MKWLLVLFALVVFAANAAAYSDAEQVQRSLCSADYQCKDGCKCISFQDTVPKMCFCYSQENKRPELVCRRSEYL